MFMSHHKCFDLILSEKSHHLRKFDSLFRKKLCLNWREEIQREFLFPGLNNSKNLILTLLTQDFDFYPLLMKNNE